MGYQKVYGEGRERAVERGGACVFRAGHYDLGKMAAVLGCTVEVGSSHAGACLPCSDSRETRH
jgi:hypothetical protein